MERFLAAFLFPLILAVGPRDGGGLRGGETPAALKCANPALPAAILAGGNAAVSSDVDATPLRMIQATANDVSLSLAVAADDASRESGLMCVTALKPRAGMLFAFSSTNEWTFWMKNTVVPLDMLWLDTDGTVAHVESDVPASKLDTPADRIARRRGRGEYVIELAAGEAARDGLQEGTKLVFPAVHATQ